MRDGPLDMRMGRDGPTAADLVNELPEETLTRVLGVLGEERRAGSIARAIVRHRRERPLARTGDLADLVERVLPRKPGDRIHPATRSFQALRILVNGELQELVAALIAAEQVLKEGGRLAVVTFHSLEDRIVKQFLAHRTGRIARPSRMLPSRPLGLRQASAIFCPVEGQPAKPRRWRTRAPVRPACARRYARARRRFPSIRMRSRPCRARPGGAAMLRILNGLLVLTLLGAAFVMYTLEHDTRRGERRIAKLEAEIQNERELIRLLEAEWSNLSRPQRLERLAAEHLSSNRSRRFNTCCATSLAQSFPLRRWWCRA